LHASAQYGAGHTLTFIKRLDELHTVEERKATQLKIPMERRIFPKGKDDRVYGRRRARLPSCSSVSIAVSQIETRVIPPARA
jgi:hypothetical protein